jgi:hypothetical protein
VISASAMLALALQIIVPLFLAALIGFICAWQMQKYAVKTARQDRAEALDRLMKISGQLHTFRKMEGQMSKSSNRIAACESELRMVDNDLRRLLYDMMKDRKRIPHKK